LPISISNSVVWEPRQIAVLRSPVLEGFLNPGLNACLANNARRRWEPHKYASMAQQNAMLATLRAWVTV
jgi:hypothetical protein